MDTLIGLEGVEKSFSGEKVLRGLSMRIPRGCCYGFLGRNGAGKTTTIKIIMGFLTQDSGNVLLMGQNPREIPTALKEKVAYVSENQILPEHLDGNDLTRFNRSLYPKWDSKLVDGLLEKYKIPKNKAIKKLSKGMQKFMALVLAMGQNPELLILDEPASGLDPVARQEFVERVMDMLYNEEKTVFFSSHILSDVDKIVNRVGILKDGRLMMDTELDELKQHVKQVQFDFKGRPDEKFELPGALAKKTIGNTMVFTVKDFDEAQIGALKLKTSAEVRILDLNFEEIFIELVK